MEKNFLLFCMKLWQLKFLSAEALCEALVEESFIEVASPQLIIILYYNRIELYYMADLL